MGFLVRGVTRPTGSGTAYVELSPIARINHLTGTESKHWPCHPSPELASALSSADFSRQAFGQETIQPVQIFERTHARFMRIALTAQPLQLRIEIIGLEFEKFRDFHTCLDDVIGRCIVDKGIHRVVESGPENVEILVQI